LSKSTSSRSQLKGTRKGFPFYRLKLTQKAEVALEEDAQVRDAVLGHRHAVWPHPEREPGVLLGVHPGLLEHAGVHHASAEHLQPPRPLADLAVGVGTTAAEAAHVELDARLGELEVAGPEPDGHVLAEDLAG